MNNVDLGALTILLPGLLVLGVGIWQRLRELAPRHWLQVTGHIVASKIDIQRTRRGYQYVPIIEYEYRVEGKPFSSSRWRMANFVSGRRDEAQSVLSRYPTGCSIFVFVHPKHRVKAVLEYGATPLSWIPLALGFVLAAVGMLLPVK